MNFHDEQALELFYEILRIRRIEEAIALHYPHQKIRSPIHLSIGQEVPAVTLCKQLSKADQIVSNHRPHAHYLAKGGNLNKLIAELYGKQTGCTSGRGGSLHLADLDVGFYGSAPVVGSSIPVGTGLAFASSLKNEPTITCIFFGEGATEEGIFMESMNFAALKKLSVLFVCENNSYSLYSPLKERQPEGRSCVKLAQASGLYADSGNGNDVEEAYQVMQNALEHIRSGSGPAFVEFETHRLREHCGPQTDLERGFQSKEETESKQEKCPLKAFREKLLEKQLLSEAKLDILEEKIAGEIKRAFSFAEESPLPEFDFDDEHVFVRQS